MFLILTNKSKWLLLSLKLTNLESSSGFTLLQLGLINGNLLILLCNFLVSLFSCCNCLSLNNCFCLFLVAACIIEQACLAAHCLNLAVLVVIKLQILLGRRLG